MVNMSIYVHRLCSSRRCSSKCEIVIDYRVYTALFFSCGRVICLITRPSNAKQD